MYNFTPNFNFRNIDLAATNTLICPDQYVAVYTIGTALLSRTYSSISYDLDVNGNPKSSTKRKNTIAIILESPHIDEFEYVNGIFAPKGPLVGKWNDFAQNFDGAIKNSKIYQKINGSKSYNIAFINAVQYQCSLGKPLSGKHSYNTQKSKNVINCWHSGFNIDLIKRLQALQPTIIINLVGKNSSFANQIYNMIATPNNKVSHITYTDGYHPSCWVRNKKSKKLID